MKTMAKSKKPAGGGNLVNWPEILKALRKANGGMTQEEAARKTRVALRTWISWENNHRKPSGPALQLLLIAFPELNKILKK